MNASKVTEIIKMILEEEPDNIYINDKEIFEKFEDYVKYLGDVKMDELSKTLEKLTKDRLLKRSVRGGNYRYCYNRNFGLKPLHSTFAIEKTGRNVFHRQNLADERKTRSL